MLNSPHKVISPEASAQTTIGETHLLPNLVGEFVCDSLIPQQAMGLVANGCVQFDSRRKER